MAWQGAEAWDGGVTGEGDLKGGVVFFWLDTFMDTSCLLWLVSKNSLKEPYCETGSQSKV